MMSSFSDGSWLTAERIRAVATLFAAATILTLLYLLATSTGTLDRWGRPLGTDFSNVWTAGRMALAGEAAQAWDWQAHHEVQKAAHGDPEVPFYGWHYPPPFLMLAALLASLPYLWALLLWQLSTLLLAALLVMKILPRRPILLPMLAAPVVLICLGHGHNGFLTAALLGGGLFMLDRRPLIAGLLLGCLVYKPQFALLIPPLLIVGRHWRAIAGASLSSGLLIAATLLLWGWPVWQAFIESLPLTREIVVEAGATGWSKIQSPFAMVMMWGGTLPWAYAAQGLATAASIAVASWLAASAGARLRDTAACAAAILSTPYVLDYDYVVLGVGCAFLLADGFRRGFLSHEKSLVALIWAAPLFARPLGAYALLPLGQATALILLALAVRRALLLDDAARGLTAWPFRHSHGSSVP